tara:strand:- start:275 stop:805 length:531 start_codon:yes stop_codon:yes gene_type:complete
MAKKIDIQGRQFGKWIVVAEDTENRSKNTYWRCVCECGAEASVDGSHLRKGKSVSCRMCSGSKHKGKLNSRVWCRARYGARKRGYKFTVSKSYLYDLFYKEQKEQCALTGVSLCIANTIKGDRRGESTASLDRIDSSLGYIKKNVQWVHKDINKMKMDLAEYRFVELCGLVVSHKG